MILEYSEENFLILLVGGVCLSETQAYTGCLGGFYSLGWPNGLQVFLKEEHPIGAGAWGVLAQRGV